MPFLEEVLRIHEEVPNVASEVNTNAHAALTSYRLGAVEKALAYAGKVLSLAEGITPTVYSLDLAFSAIAQIYFELWAKGLDGSDASIDPHLMKGLAKRALKLLRTFQGVFPIGRAYTAYYQGWYDELTGKQQAAIDTWRRGLLAAQKFGLSYEEGLLRLKLGVSGAGAEHIQRAIDIFTVMGAARELQRAVELQQKRKTA